MNKSVGFNLLMLGNVFLLVGIGINYGISDNRFGTTLIILSMIFNIPGLILTGMQFNRLNSNGKR
ncbi:hypothetical protein QFZ81_003700 [Paenibacillus sp. V4I9]|uniref:hypothetical protein n=1 Tax=Paenibacillus sp. V4I9 TaxID=3042308 RepID=UPI00278A9491|nr:hypothetical protein [Paenibacillus sp. V4I9]MDQ0888612.1 hypothetical protein [Paenibacillus sp. V4I9]